MYRINLNSTLFVAETLLVLNGSSVQIERVCECNKLYAERNHLWLQNGRNSIILYNSVISSIFTLILIRLFVHHFHILDLSNNHLCIKYQTNDERKVIYSYIVCIHCMYCCVC